MATASVSNWITSARTVPRAFPLGAAKLLLWMFDAPGLRSIDKFFKQHWKLGHDPGFVVERQPGDQRGQ